jgi:hypothetical protein
MGKATIYQTAQIGVEVTPGTLIAATKKLNSVGFTMSPEPEIQVFRPAGSKYPTVASLSREQTNIDIDGQLTYTEIVYLLSGILAKATITGMTEKMWTFTPSSNAADLIQTYTIEQGDADRAHRVGYTLITDLTLTFNRDEGGAITGTAIGTAMEEPVTLTPTPTEIALVPITGPQIKIYMADTYAGLAGATEMSHAVSLEWSMSNRFGPAWFLNGSNVYDQHVELEPELELTLLIEADDEGMGIFPIMRTGATKFIRVEAIGPVIGAGPGTYKFTLDTAAKVTDVGDFDDADGVYAIEYTFGGFHDPTWGAAVKAEVVNELAAL